MPEYYEWEIAAVRPDRAADIFGKIVPTIKAALKEHGLSHLLKSGEIVVEKQEHFPHWDAQATDILVKFGTTMALEAFRSYVLPKLRGLANVGEGKKRDVPKETPTKGAPAAASKEPPAAEIAQATKEGSAKTPKSSARTPKVAPRKPEKKGRAKQTKKRPAKGTSPKKAPSRKAVRQAVNKKGKRKGRRSV